MRGARKSEKSGARGWVPWVGSVGGFLPVGVGRFVSGLGGGLGGLGGGLGGFGGGLGGGLGGPWAFRL